MLKISFNDKPFVVEGGLVAEKHQWGGKFKTFHILEQTDINLMYFNCGELNKKHEKMDTEGNQIMYQPHKTPLT